MAHRNLSKRPVGAPLGPSGDGLKHLGILDSICGYREPGFVLDALQSIKSTTYASRAGVRRANLDSSGLVARCCGPNRMGLAKARGVAGAGAVEPPHRSALFAASNFLIRFISICVLSLGIHTASERFL